MLSKSGVQQVEWKENREDAYYGSIMHFFRTLYQNEIKSPVGYNPEGFETRKRVKLVNAEKQRLKEKYLADQQDKKPSWPEDSLKYYKKVMQQPDPSAINTMLTAGDLVVVQDDGSRSMFFTDNLSVTYRKKIKLGKENQRSTIHLLTPAPLIISENGSYDSPMELFTTGYWAGSQKLASLLPLDYSPDPE
jgi:hypothetical protein